MNIEWVGSPNYWTGRNGRKIIAIVDHIAAGYMPGCLDWLKNPQSKSSAQYLVTRAGKVCQLVREADTAWHAGVANKPNWPLYDGTNPNRYTLGIEHEGFPADGLTEAQYQATLQLHKELIAKYSIPIDTDHIIGHYRIDSVDRANCPGPKFPWSRLFTDLKGITNINTPWQWAVEKGIVSGNPQAGATLGDVATMIYKAMGGATIPVPGYTKRIMDSVLVVEIDPMLLRCRDMVLKSGKELAKEYKNFTNANFYLWEGGKIKKTIGWLVSEGEILASRYEHKEYGWAGNPKGTLVVYRDGKVEVGWKWDSDIEKVEKDVWFMVQGFNLYPPKMTIRDGLAKEGWTYDSVAYRTNRLAIGYNPATKKVVITVEKNSNAEQAIITTAKFGCEGNAICLDSGLSCNAVVDGEEFITTDRQLANIIYW